MSFGRLGEGITYKVRVVLYKTILQKHIGWFDDKENGTSVLTSAMAEDTALINGVSAESLAPQIEGSFAIIAGITIGLIYCWQEALVCICLAPFMSIGKKVSAKIIHGLNTNQNDLKKDADLLCGDAIVNYKTV